MKKETVNEFKDGLNLDLNPIVTPSTVLTDNLNGTFITYNGNEFCLQNDRGNIKKADLVESQDFIKYIPIGAKEHNGMIYIVAVMDLHGNQDASEEITGHRCILGCYPGLGDNNELDNSKFSLLPNNTDHTGYYWNGDIFDKEHPVTIEVQDSYDGSVNLIIVDNKNKPRIINSGFSVLPNNKYEIITRNNEGTNLYTYPEEMELIRTSNKIVNFDLKEVQSGGQLKGGNYTFYLKFGDGDYNKTDIVAESGIISIFKGTDGIPSTISGTLADERTDKMIQLEITGIDSKYSKLYLYYTREYSDTQGYRMTESCALTEPIDIISPLGLNNSQKIWINGFEQSEPINIEELNVDYHTIDWARAEAQHSNMLFLGNVGQEETYNVYKSLDALSKNITTQICQDGNVLGYVYPGTYSCPNGSEYYDTSNIYYNLGYWPDEYYRFGIVYILKDGSTTPVFNMNGCKFTAVNQRNTDFQENNNYGVFKTPNILIMGSSGTTPLYFKFSLPSEINYDLRNKISGYFIVRQKRIPLTLCQGLSIGIDSVSHTPITWNGSSWITESFISHTRKLRTAGVQPFENPVLIYNDISVNGSTNGSTVEVEQYKTAFKKISEQTFSNDEDPTESPYDVLTRALTYANGQQGTIICEPDSDTISGLATTRYEVSVTVYWLTVNNMAVDTNYTHLIVITDNKGTDWDETYDGKRVLVTENWAQAAQQDIVNANEELLIHSTAESNKFINLNHTLFNTWGIASLDPCVNSSVSSKLDGSELNVRREYNVHTSQNGLIISNEINGFDANSTLNDDFKCAFISPETNVKTIGDYSYSNIAGNGASVKGTPLSWCYFMEPVVKNGKVVYKTKNDEEGKVAKFEKWREGEYKSLKSINLNQLNRNINLVRGKFLPYVGVASSFNWKNIDSVTANHYMGIYSIRNQDVSEAISVRSNDNSPFYAVSKRYPLNTEANVHRGDCYICTVTMRVVSNFIDVTAPVSTEIVDPYSWSYNVVVRAADATSVGNMIAYDDVNLSDVNTVSLGYWISFKCLSSYNLGLRSINSFHSDEMSLLGSPRSFYPLNGGSTATGNKVPESFLLNDGYSATVGEKRYKLLPDQPYSKSEFANRIMFSNVHITDAFTNGYRTFQGLSYKDYDKQYGAITKLVPYGQNLLVIMEHGIGLVPVNPKALMQTTTGEAIHIYGYGVLPNEMTIISQDYGSKYEHSIVRTPIGVYGIDADAKKIWLFSDKQGFQTISDMNIETFLKDYLKPINVELPDSDVRTHYNAFKGDLMFTWKDGDNGVWNICYNERNRKWVTRYDWCPIISENINDNFYSLQSNEGVLGENELDCVKIWSHTPDSSSELPEPTEWYNKQHVFEFEFVVSDPIGVNKVFDNLQIISNNTQPEWLEIAVMGDSYMNKRELIDPDGSRVNKNSNNEWEHKAFNTQQVKTTSNLHNEISNWPEDARFGRFKWDWRLKENLLIKWQPFKDIYKFGRRIGNIQYKDSIWYANIEPIIMNDKEVRIRDKWARIRIRYSGEDMAVITAIRTLINI